MAAGNGFLFESPYHNHSTLPQDSCHPATKNLHVQYRFHCPEMARVDNIFHCQPKSISIFPDVVLIPSLIPQVTITALPAVLSPGT